MGGDPLHHMEGIILTTRRSDLQEGSYFRKPGENSWLRESSPGDFKQDKLEHELPMLLWHRQVTFLKLWKTPKNVMLPS